MRRLNFKESLLELKWASIAIISGAIVVYIGLRLLNVRMDVFYGISTFNPVWITALFVVPFIAGIVVSVVYGLGGKILAHFSPLLVIVPDYLLLDQYSLPEGVTILPLGYWILLVIVAVEFASLGGFVGEIMIKKTYGRRPKHLIHKRYQRGFERLEEKIGLKANTESANK
jgi:hypothetical protein